MERTKEERTDDPIVVEMEPPWRGLTESSVILSSLWCVFVHGMGVDVLEKRRGEKERYFNSLYHDVSQKILIANEKTT